MKFEKGGRFMLFSRRVKMDETNMLFSKKEVNKIVFPLIAQQVLAVTVGMFDTMMVSSAGEAAISGVSLVNTLNLLLIYIFSSLASGGAVVISQFMGRRDMKTANEGAKQLWWVVFVISSLVMLLSLVLCSPMLKLIFGAIEPDVMQNAKIYFIYLAISFPMLGIYNACAAIFRAMGNTKISLTTSIIMNFVNIAGNAILIYIFKMGAAGAAIATSLSRLVGAVIMMILLYDKNNPLFFDKLLKVKPNWPIIKNVCGIGIPNGLENSMFQFGKVLTQSLIATFGTAQIAANAVGNSVTSIQYTAGTAIGMAMITIVGRCVGAEEKEQAKQYAAKLLKMTYGIIIAVSVFVCLFVNQIVGLYSLAGESGALAKEIILFHSLCVSTIWPIAFTLPNSFRAASDVRFTMILSIVSMWIFRVMLSYVFGKYMGMGVMGVWYAMACDWIFRAIFFGIRYIKGTWLTKYKPIEQVK